MNSYPSGFQMTCYMSATKATSDICAGIGKGEGIFHKNPARHMADLEMLETMEDMQPSFIQLLTACSGSRR